MDAQPKEAAKNETCCLAPPGAPGLMLVAMQHPRAPEQVLTLTPR